MAKIEIAAPDGFLKIHVNVTKVKQGEKVQWSVDVGDDYCAEIVFHSQHGIVGPLAHAGGHSNPARGWYKGQGRVDFETIVDQPAGMWKYDIMLHHVATGQQVDCKDPWIHVNTGP